MSFRPKVLVSAGFYIALAVLLGPGIVSAFPGSFLLPKQDIPIDKNIVKLAIPEVVGRDTVKKAHFYVRYSQYATNKVSLSRINKLLMVDPSPPFEIVWDCTNVPDQDNFNLFFYYKITNTKGWLISNPDTFMMNCALDRNPAILDQTWQSRQTGRPIKVDGRLKEWDWADSVVFTNNDNRIIAASAWDAEHLYFAVKVSDADVFPANDDPPESVVSFMMDGIELFLDIDHNHNVIRDSRDFQLLLPVTGKFNLFIPPSYADRRSGKERRSYSPLPVVIRTDFGFQAEIALKWEELELQPAPGDSLGVNLVNSDREDARGVVMTASWAGISDLLHHNPSEWANLLLTEAPAGPRQKGLIILGVLLGLLALFMLIGMLTKDKEPGPDTATSETNQERVIKQVKEYIINNIGNENLDLKNVAAQVDLSPDYLRQLFKKTTDRNFSTYLNHIRVEKAVELLNTTNKRITEIAFEAGFGTYQNFNRVFKDAMGCTPKEHRARSADNT